MKHAGGAVHTASYDPDGTIASYQWRQVSGCAVALSSASSAQTSISIPRNISPLPNALVFELTVTDNAGNAASDTVRITVTR
jgi:chitinase